MGDTLKCLLDICPDTETCKPKEFDFHPHRPPNETNPEKEKEKEKKEKEEKRQRLPRRLLLSAFSDKVGHRPTGLQKQQAKLFVERFPTEFKEMAMQKIVLPCSKEEQPLPFVTVDGLLPCPCLSTCVAL